MTSISVLIKSGGGGVSISDDSSHHRFYSAGQTKGAYSGDFILAAASQALAKLRHNQVMQIMSEILENLVQGESMSSLP